MKNKVIVIIFILVIIILSVVYCILKEIDKKSCDKYFNEEYIGATVLKITTNLEENKDFTNSKYEEKGVIVVDTCFNNTVSKKDNYLKLIEYEVVIDSLNYFKINKTKILSNKKFEQIKESIDTIKHYEPEIQLKTPCYRIDIRNEESFVVTQVDLNIDSLF